MLEVSSARRRQSLPLARFVHAHVQVGAGARASGEALWKGCVAPFASYVFASPRQPPFNTGAFAAGVALYVARNGSSAPRVSPLPRVQRR